jgi:hypothetical protein
MAIGGDCQMSIRAEAVPKLARRTLALFVFFLLAVITGMTLSIQGESPTKTQMQRNRRKTSPIIPERERGRAKGTSSAGLS